MNKFLCAMMCICLPLAGWSAIYSENFEGLTPGPIDGQDGWGGQNAGDAATGDVVAGSIGAWGGSQVLQLNSSWDGRDLPSLSGSDFYYGFTTEFATTGGTANETFLRLNAWNTFVALKTKGSGTQQIEAQLGGGGVVSSTDPSIVDGSIHRVVGKLTWGGTEFTQHDIFLNPVGAEGANTPIVTAVGGDALSAPRLNIRNQNTDSLVDRIVFTDNWAEAVPEPGTMILFGFGGLLLVAYRRFRR